MCLTIPKKLIFVKGKKAETKDGTVDVSIIKNPKPGDWVLVNANLAVHRIPEAEAKEINKLLKND